MFRDYVLIVDPDGASRRQLVSELVDVHPLLVASDMEGAFGRIRRWGPPRAVVLGRELTVPGDAEAIQELLATCRSRVIRMGRAGEGSGDPSDGTNVTWVESARDVAFEIDREEISPAAAHVLLLGTARELGR